MPGPLEGIRVVDFTWVGAGPFATKPLADQGAEVIKIESRTRLDAIRNMHPFKDGIPGVNRSGYFANRNTSKRAVTLNLKKPEAVKLALRLIAISDVVCNNFSAGTMQRLGLGYEEVRKVRPDIIYVEAPMQGTWGPHASFRGYGVTISALAGIHYLTALPGREPVGTGTNYPDHVPNCLHMALAILMALLHRSRTGEGQYIEISQFESTVAVIGPAVMDYAVNGRVVQPTGNKVSYACPHGAYPCKGEDRWCVIAVFDPVQWRSLCEAMGRPELEADPRFATLVARKEHEAELDKIISDWTRARTREEVFWTLQRAGVPVGMVNDAADLLDRDIQLAAREHWVFLDHPEMGRCVYDAPPYRSERLNPRPLRPAPLVGQDNEYVFKQLLGLSDDEYNAYLEQGVFD